MLYRILGANPRPDHKVLITWSDGFQGLVDFGPTVAKGRIFSAMRDPDYFVREMRLAPDGTALGWPGEVDFSADGLRYRANPGDAMRDLGPDVQ